MSTLPLLAFPQAYIPTNLDLTEATREVHIFADDSEPVYDAVAHLRTQTKDGQIHLAFIFARSRLAPKRVHSIPRLELCSARVAAQLARLLATELTLDIADTILRSHSMTALTWLQSQSCRFKVFDGAMVAEIQELTGNCTWRYVDSAQNSAVDLMRGKTLKDLKDPNRRSEGPPFVLKGPDYWPERPNADLPENMRSFGSFLFFAELQSPPLRIAVKRRRGIVPGKSSEEETVAKLQRVISSSAPPTNEGYREAESQILLQAQRQSFPEDYKALATGKPMSPTSRLLTLAPTLNLTSGLIRVGGRLRWLEDVDFLLHPAVLDATH